MTDYVIIGGGVYGSATAWALARSGADVHLIEKRTIANRASGGPGQRGVRANGRDVRELPLMKAAYRQWPELHERIDALPFYQRSGQLLVVERESDLARTEIQHRLQCHHGIESQWLNRDQVRELEPNISERIIAAVYCPHDGVANHGATTKAFAAAAKRAGAVIDEGVSAKAVEIKGGRATGVITTEGERIAAHRGVLVLANSAVRELVSEWVDLPVWNDVLQVLVSGPLETVPFTHLVGHMHRTVSLKTEAGNAVMISGGWPGRWDAESEQGHALQQSVDANVAEAVAVFPQLEGINIETADASHQESVSLDGVPVIDNVHAAPNLYYAAGWSGHGWAIAPVVAEMLADWALTGNRPEILAPFAHRRFE
jgi:sarcosine oxidase subunit beta